jgi:hypothetical protein
VRTEVHREKALLLSRAKERVEIDDLLKVLWEIVLEEEGHNDEFPIPTPRHVQLLVERKAKL